MSKVSSRDRKIAWYILNEIDYFSHKILKHSIDKQKLLKVFIEVIKHYDMHKNEYGLCVESIDPYKVCSWCLDELLKSEDSKYIVVIIVVMVNFLSKENRKFNVDCLKYIIKMYKNNNKKDSLAIGKNGLYMVFWSASNCKII